MRDMVIRLGIFFCVTQSAMFSGGNLAFYRLSRLRLEVEAKRDECANRVLDLRKDSNFLLATFCGATFLSMCYWPYSHCHRPIVVRDKKTTLGDVIRKLKQTPSNTDDAIRNDVVLIWIDEPRIVTDGDILSRLLTGIGNHRYA